MRWRSKEHFVDLVTHWLVQLIQALHHTPQLINGDLAVIQHLHVLEELVVVGDCADTVMDSLEKVPIGNDTTAACYCLDSCCYKEAHKCQQTGTLYPPISTLDSQVHYLLIGALDQEAQKEPINWCVKDLP